LVNDKAKNSEGFRLDRFHWLEEESFGTKAWLDSQRARLVAGIEKIPSVESLVTAFFSHASVDAPVEVGGKCFYARQEPNEPQAKIYLQGQSSPDRLLLDPTENGLHPYCSASLISVSMDGNVFAYGIRLGGSDDMRVRIADSETGRILCELPDFKTWRYSLSADLRGYFYVRQEGGAYWLCAHDLTDPKNDSVLCGPVRLLNASCISAQGSINGKCVLIRLYPDGLQGTPEYRFLHRQTSTLSPSFYFSNYFSSQYNNDRFYVLTDWKAPNKRILLADDDHPFPHQWRELIPECKMPIQQLSLVGGKLLVNYVNGFSTEIRMFTPEGNFEAGIELPPEGTAGQPTGSFASRDTFFEFSSLTHPHTVFRLHIPTRKLDIWHKSAAPFCFGQLKTEKVQYLSRDGTEIPMTLTHRRDVVLGPETPVILTAYGGFGVSETARFTRRSALWIAMGGLFVKANIRGGGEFGENWHHAATRERRQNAIDDFISAAEWLVAEQYTSARRLAIVGGSNGGLLVGAALVQRPELFAAVVCFGPILDLLRYHLFQGGELGLKEYGCADNPSDLAHLQRLSPYHNVVDGVRYPAVLFISGDADTRCHPMHARKMCARLQEATVSGRPILIDYHAYRGHAGKLPLKDRIETLTTQLCFLVKELGMYVNGAGHMEPASLLRQPKAE
jgi:prolyl oligopeptidase